MGWKRKGRSARAFGSLFLPDQGRLGHQDQIDVIDAVSEREIVMKSREYLVLALLTMLVLACERNKNPLVPSISYARPAVRITQESIPTLEGAVAFRSFSRPYLWEKMRGSDV